VFCELIDLKGVRRFCPEMGKPSIESGVGDK